jgi:hypothetical protein
MVVAKSKLDGSNPHHDLGFIQNQLINNQVREQLLMGKSCYDASRVTKGEKSLLALIPLPLQIIYRRRLSESFFLYLISRGTRIEINITNNNKAFNPK